MDMRRQYVSMPGHYLRVAQVVTPEFSCRNAESIGFREIGQDAASIPVHEQHTGARGLGTGLGETLGCVVRSVFQQKLDRGGGENACDLAEHLCGVPTHNTSEGRRCICAYLHGAKGGPRMCSPQRHSRGLESGEHRTVAAHGSGRK